MSHMLSCRLRRCAAVRSPADDSRMRSSPARRHRAAVPHREDAVDRDRRRQRPSANSAAPIRASRSCAAALALGAGALERPARLGERPQRRALAGAAARLRQPAAGLGRACATRARAGTPATTRRARLAAAAPAAVPRRVARRRRRGPDHRLLRAAGRGLAPATRAGFACRSTARPPTWPRAARTGRASRSTRCRPRSRAEGTRARLRRRPARRADAADPGLGPAAHHRARRQPAAGARWPSRPQRPAVQVGRPLADRAGRAAPDQASWPGDPAWARAATRSASTRCCGATRATCSSARSRCPIRALGPKGAQAVPLTPGRSIAVDPQSIPYGTPVWLDTTEPLSSTPLRRAVWRRTPAARSSARCAPTTSGAGAPRPRRRPAA